MTFRVDSLMWVHPYHVLLCPGKSIPLWPDLDLKKTVAFVNQQKDWKWFGTIKEPLAATALIIGNYVNFIYHTIRHLYDSERSTLAAHILLFVDSNAINASNSRPTLPIFHPLLNQSRFPLLSITSLSVNVLVHLSEIEIEKKSIMSQIRFQMFIFFQYR